MLSQPPQESKEKDAGGALQRPFSVLLTVLSIFILAYIDLRCNSKTVPILCQNCANYLPPASVGKNSSKIRRLSWAVYPHRMELNASTASFLRR